MIVLIIIGYNVTFAGICYGAAWLIVGRRPK
jgi:hypothetical protein